LSLALFGTIFFLYVNTIDAPLGEDVFGMNWTNLVENSPGFDPNLVKLAFIFIIVGFGTKAGLAPMHT